MKRPSYAGGKGGSGTIEFLTNWLKPCYRYVSLFAGHDALLWELKKLPKVILINDLDFDVLDQWKSFETFKKRKERFLYSTQDGMFLLNTYNDPLYTNEAANGLRTTIFIDPPYSIETRCSQKKYYKNEMSSEAEHIKLIDNILNLNEKMVGVFDIMITHYPCDLYKKHFTRDGWYINEFVGRTRNGITTEWLISNYPKPSALQDSSRIGNDFRQRQDFARKIQRWKAKFQAFDPQLRHAIINELQSLI